MPTSRAAPFTVVFSPVSNRRLASATFRMISGMASASTIKYFAPPLNCVSLQTMRHPRPVSVLQGHLFL